MPSHAQAPSLPPAPQALATPSPPPASPAAGVWQLDLLGRVQLRCAHSSVTRWPSRAVAALLARLALQPGRDHPREELIELLWPGVALDKGRQRLRQALSLLRRVLAHGPGTLPQLLQADRLLIRLQPQAIDCDVLQLERHLATGAFEQARALYAGELMPGYYDDWIVVERHRLESLRESLGARPTSPTTPTHRPEASRPALAAAQLPARAQEAAAVGDAGNGTALPALPAYWTRAFGLAHSSARLQQVVLSHRLVTVIGPGGHGKTRLAVETAAALGAATPQGFSQLGFVSMADTHSLQALWLALAQALALAPNLGADPARQVLARVGSQPMLLVLDNLEQLPEAANLGISTLLQACPQLHLLLTSRRRLGLVGEQLFEMPSLPLPAEVTDAAAADRLRLAPLRRPLPSHGQAAEAIDDNPAVALFVDRARESRPEFNLTVHNTQAVVGLVRLLGGMPLAIELAASRLRALQPRELLQRLRDDDGSPLLDLLARPAVAASADARHASMRQVVAWSWRQLSPEAAALLRAMSVFAFPATLQAVAQALAGLPDAAGEALGPQPDAESDDVGTLPLARVQALLADAVDASLVQVITAPALDVLPEAGSRYALLPPVREFAAEQRGAGEAAAVRGRLRRWLASLARQGLPKQRQALQADLRHAWGLLLRAREDQAPAQALALAVAQQAGDLRAQALILRLQAAQQAYHHGAPAAAMPLFEQSVALFEQLGDLTQMTMRQIELAHCWAQTGREQAALALLQRCMHGDAHPAGSPTLIYALTEVGRVRLRLRDPAAAQPVLQQALQLALQHDWLALVLPALLLLPQAWLGCGQAEQAALLHGHLLASWPGDAGALNHLNQRSCRRTHGLLAQALGSAPAARLTIRGRRLSREQALAMVFED